MARGQQGHRLRADAAARRRRDRLGQKPCRHHPGGAADRLREHLPQHPVRAGAGRTTSTNRSRSGRSRSVSSATRSPSIPELFLAKDTHSMEWYYPVLGGAVRGAAAQARIDARWDEFVVPGLGIRCVDHRPWVTGAETCELVMALDAMGDSARAHEQFAAMHHLRETDGSYWTGLVFADGKRWPVERTTWTGAAMILAADALSSTTRRAAASSAARICRAASRASSTAPARRSARVPRAARSAPAPASTRSHRPRGTHRSPVRAGRCGTAPGRRRRGWGTRRG